MKRPDKQPYEFPEGSGEMENCFDEWKAYEKYNKNGDTDKYKYCNHHHELTEGHEMVDFGSGEFVANKQAIPLLKALNEAGLKTRSHHLANEDHGFVCILLDNVTIEVRKVNEKDATRTEYNGKYELLIQWDK